MNKSDYISKMDFILQDSYKFENLGPSSKTDNSAKIEAHIQRRLLQLNRDGFFPSKIYNSIQLISSQRFERMVCQKFTRKMYPYVSFCQ